MDNIEIFAKNMNFTQKYLPVAKTKSEFVLKFFIIVEHNKTLKINKIFLQLNFGEILRKYV